jgi:hypothetical protein
VIHTPGANADQQLFFRARQGDGAGAHQFNAFVKQANHVHGGLHVVGVSAYVFVPLARVAGPNALPAADLGFSEFAELLGSFARQKDVALARTMSQ